MNDYSLHLMFSRCLEAGPGLGAALLTGFAASLHCLAMCGGLSASLALRFPSKPAGVLAGGGTARISLRALVEAQTARIGVYAVFGAVAGAVGHGLKAGPLPVDMLEVMSWASAAVLVTIGLSIAGLAPVSGLAARLAAPLTRRLHHLHRFGPAGLGMVWGLMPCSMVYLMTLYAGMSGGALSGAALMAAFGIATLPALTAAAAGADIFTRLGQTKTLRLAAGGALAGLGILGAAL